ncbi:MAG: histidine kinase [Saprospiraceae bacterium]|nr:histidine kinase [Saprospiraceae bacterium]
MKVQITDTQKKVLFHLSLWSIWMFLSVSNARDEELYIRTVIVSTVIVTTHIPLFLLNTEWLIPHIFPRKGAVVYFWSLMGILAAFSFLHYHIFKWVAQYHGIILDWGSGKVIMKGTLALVMVAAISTGYGLLNYVVRQERQQQEKKQERLQSELSFLRSQISPHFIFNVLNSLVYLIRSKSELAEPVIIKLSELMRYMLYESENTQIPLEKELAYLQNYIELQKIRFEEDVEIRFHIDGNATDQLIEPMLLIPFVENAYKHGVSMLENPVIEIDIKIREQDLDLLVKNKVAPATADLKDAGTGIGLKNVGRRLELLYPEAHTLNISHKNGWFSVHLHIDT